MADQGQRGGTSNTTKRGDGTTLERSDVHRNPMKRMIDTAQQLESEAPEQQEPKKKPVMRGDGTVLPERSEKQPRNPMKRMMDTEPEGREKEL